MYAVLAVGFLCLAVALYNFPLEQISFQLFVLVAFTLGFGSRISVQIPRFTSHIAVSDAFIFLALMLFGGEVAVVLAAAEAFTSSWRFCSKKISVFFNAAMWALSTTTVVLVLNIFGYYSADHLHGRSGRLSDYIIVLSIIALTQFLANTAIASVYGALRTEQPIWQTWKTTYLWTFITYFVGAVTAGALVQFHDRIGFGVIIAVFPVIYFVYLTYKMYLENVKMSIAQAEQAKRHAEILEKQSKALAESEERFRSAFDYAPIGIAIVSPSGRWLKVNHALSQILGYSEKEFLATDYQSMLCPDDLGNTLIKIHELLSGKIPACQMEQRYISKSGETVWASWSVSAASDSKSNQPNLIFQIQDITDKKIAEQKLHYDATHDPLTGLPNRKRFMEKLQNALQTASENKNHKVSILFIDLDRFKFVNDSLGHQTGDELLVGIAERLRDCVRPTDTVARLGGDEFTILVEGKYEEQEVVRIAERIQEKFTIPFNLDGHEVYSSASIGILHATERHQTPEDLMRDADTAMYQAKRAGKARHEIFDENMHEAMKETLQLETDLRRAIENREFEVFYQPIYSLQTGRIEGFEALARWNHKRHGIISPDKFIELAEEIGVIDALGEQILEKACRQMMSLKHTFAGDFFPILSINMSCKQFGQVNLAKRVEKILDETGFPAGSLKLEITESVFIEHRERAVETLHKLRDLGIEINIDDFGTGYSNLTYLLQLPISTLKIDRSFIAPLEANEHSLQIVQTIMMMARSLGLKVVAEGVETELQLEQLKKLNCEGAQGFYFARPMNFEDVKTFLNEKQIIQLPTEFDTMPIVPTIQ
jgi:diguanylate cyclase (GGDEF)-like protein/PAS domain S-box-containing protein